MRADSSNQQGFRSRLPPGAPEDSPYAAQLQRGFAGLRFDAQLEHEFRTAFRAESRSQIRRNLWLAVALVIAFAVMTRLVLVRMPGQVALWEAPVFHWPPTRAEASKITGARPCAASQRAAASPAGPAPITATLLAGMM